MKITNGEITIRDFLEKDIEKKVEWINNPQNNTFLHYDIPLSVEKTKQWFLNKNNVARLDCIIEFSNVPVGLIGLLNIDKINKKAEFYITVGETCFKRKGIAKRATLLLVEYAFSEMGLNKVYLNVDQKNEIACALYEKCGFVLEGVFNKDLLFKGEFVNRCRYAIIKEN